MYRHPDCEGWTPVTVTITRETVTVLGATRADGPPEDIEIPAFTFMFRGRKIACHEVGMPGLIALSDVQSKKTFLPPRPADPMVLIFTFMEENKESQDAMEQQILRIVDADMTTMRRVNFVAEIMKAAQQATDHFVKNQKEAGQN
jgi:hypothetical protein